MLTNMQGHRPKAKAENVKVNFSVNAKVNPVSQVQLFPGCRISNDCNKISK